MLLFGQVDDTDFILHFGDLSYAIGRGFLWESFGNLIDPFASRAPYMVSVGYAPARCRPHRDPDVSYCERARIWNCAGRGHSNHEYCYLTDSNGKDPSGAPGNGMARAHPSPAQIGGTDGHGVWGCGAAGYHPSWGNYGTDSGEECGIPTFYRFQTPKNGNNVFWYRYGLKTAVCGVKWGGQRHVLGDAGLRGEAGLREQRGSCWATEIDAATATMLTIARGAGGGMSASSTATSTSSRCRPSTVRDPPTTAPRACVLTGVCGSGRTHMQTLSLGRSSTSGSRRTSHP